MHVLLVCQSTPLLIYALLHLLDPRIIITVHTLITDPRSQIEDGPNPAWLRELGLPGWTTKYSHRRNGASAGRHVDKYYYSPNGTKVHGEWGVCLHGASFREVFEETEYRRYYVVYTLASVLRLPTPSPTLLPIRMSDSDDHHRHHY